MNKECQNCKLVFEITKDDMSFYERIKVPPPTFCPECRMQRRMSWRNERELYKDNCDLCSKQILSSYSPDKPFKVFCKECWYGDKWNSLEFQMEYDWRKPFFIQYRSLLEKIPRIALCHYHTCINTNYANFIADSKNVYLSYSVIKDSENIYYSWGIDKSRNCFDSLNLNNSEDCFYNIDGSRNYKSRYCVQSKECIDSSFLFDCINCQDCFMSSNLRNKRYVFRNVQYDKDGYEKEIIKINQGSYNSFKDLEREFALLKVHAFHKFGNITKSVNCSGDYTENSKNVKNSFTVSKAEDAKYCFRIAGTRDVYDITGSGDSELLYECIAGGFGSYQARFCTFNDTTRESFYSDWCHGSSNMFGCIAVEKKQHCILNKQYTKEEYEALVPKIIEHMNTMPYIDKKGRVYKYGEFFPSELSPFSYNETIAQEYFPLTKEEAIEKGYKWKDREERNYTIDIKNEDIPDNIKDVDDSIINKVIECDHSTSSWQATKGECNEQCTEAFKIIEEELKFYKRMNLPLPRLCPNCRHYQRLKQRNPLKLWHRKCMKEGCSNEFETSYARERPEIIYCEKCYQQEVY